MSAASPVRTTVVVADASKSPVGGQFFSNNKHTKTVEMMLGIQIEK